MVCECCGKIAPCTPYGEADSSGHVWTHYTCDACQNHCSSDEEGNPVHMLPGWDGSSATFELHRAH